MFSVRHSPYVSLFQLLFNTSFISDEDAVAGVLDNGTMAWLYTIGMILRHAAHLQ